MTNRQYSEAWPNPPAPELLEKIRRDREEFDARWAEQQRALWLAREPKPLTFLQKVGAMCQMLMALTLAAFLGYLMLRIVWIILVF